MAAFARLVQFVALIALPVSISMFLYFKLSLKGETHPPRF